MPTFIIVGKHNQTLYFVVIIIRVLMNIDKNVTARGLGKLVVFSVPRETENKCLSNKIWRLMLKC